MMRFRLFLPAAVLLISAAACGSQPTAPIRDVAGPRLDGGFGLGSGNRTDSTGTNTTSGQTGTVAGGFGLGSGN
jgi:hypothetical protein